MNPWLRRRLALQVALGGHKRWAVIRNGVADLVPGSTATSRGWRASPPVLSIPGQPFGFNRHPDDRDFDTFEEAVAYASEKAGNS